MSDVMVSVLMLTYNHQRYISKAIEMVLQQKTNFTFEIIIHDDASTDGTQSIIRQYENAYPEIIKPIYQKENQYSKGRGLRHIIDPYIKGNYVAWCEGDDFWMNEHKLQTQIAYLEAHQECSACVHSAYYAYENGILMHKMIKPMQENGVLQPETVISDWCFATASLVYRTKYRAEFSKCEFMNIRKQGSDLPMGIYLSLVGEMYYMDIPMSAYRLNSRSSVTRTLFNGSAEHKKTYFTETIAMFESINRYTNGRYQEILHKNIEKNQRMLARTAINVRPLDRLKYICSYKLPWVYDLLLKLKAFPVYVIDSADKDLQKLANGR